MKTFMSGVVVVPKEELTSQIERLRLDGWELVSANLDDKFPGHYVLNLRKPVTECLLVDENAADEPRSPKN